VRDGASPDGARVAAMLRVMAVAGVDWSRGEGA
jgi:hypothetical protein